jgi:hypothetical protein
VWPEALALDRDALDEFREGFGLACLLEGSAVDESMIEPIEDGGVVPLVFAIFVVGAVGLLRWFTTHANAIL